MARKNCYDKQGRKVNCSRQAAALRNNSIQHLRAAGYGQHGAPSTRPQSTRPPKGVVHGREGGGFYAVAPAGGLPVGLVQATYVGESRTGKPKVRWAAQHADGTVTTHRSRKLATDAVKRHAGLRGSDEDCGCG